MNKLLKIAVGAAALTALTVSLASAGLNAGATGRLMWLTTQNKDTKDACRNSNDASPVLGFAALGVKNLRGCDLQLLLNGVDGQVPPSWQWWSSADGSSSGCAAAAGANTYARGFNSTGAAPAADSLYNGWVGVPGVADAQSGTQYYQVNPCLTPHNVALIWFTSAGTNGANKVASKRYGLYKLGVDQNSGCPGDISDPKGVCIIANFRLPCQDPLNPRGYKFQLLDGGNNIDDCVVESAFTFLTWMAPCDTRCPGVTPAAPESWGKLKNMYH